MTRTPAGPAALETYADVLAMLASGRPTRRDLPFVRNVEGVGALFRTISAVNAVKPGAVDEEWNPLSQRPHSPLPPPAVNSLGYEIRSLKTAIDSFTTLAHEMMHIALWEPFFSGHWRPRTRSAFVEFSLMAEGYCYFFSDIVVSGAIRQRMPDGEYAMERRTHENAFFHPVRAFEALGINKREDVLAVYLEAFRGNPTHLWQPRGKAPYAAALAEQVYEFYESTLLPLSDLHAALESFKGITEHFKRFCAIPDLPSFIDRESRIALLGPDVAAYFASFYRSGLSSLASCNDVEIGRIRQRRSFQMRAYFALQVRALLAGDLVFARSLSPARRQRLIAEVASYLDDLERLLKDLSKSVRPLSPDFLVDLDDRYDRQVRAPLLAHDAWSAKRWLLIPRRAGGLIHVGSPIKLSDRDTKIRLVQLSTYFVNELTRRLRDVTTVSERAEMMSAIERVASYGAFGAGSAARARDALRSLARDLVRAPLRELWSVPLAAFEPSANSFRELAFSYQ